MTTIPRNITPPWPSLYDPGLEILHIEHHKPIQEFAAYLYRVKDIFRFTLYWTLIFYTPLFLVCGTYAFWNYAFPPSPRSRHHDVRHPHETYYLSPLNADTPSANHSKQLKANEQRSRVAFAIIVLLTFLTLSVAGAVIGSAIMGSIVAGLYQAGNFNMSTWIPFLLAVMQVVVGLLR
ncbi:hypothetical protein HYPSUDRAFT_134345 [Hypholoma sublateritium FD-334 SS-4]|uniref:Integral membrane protein n=1 Tax=Hypholoma sublateritium (strain FD-334 SS-4) TaxID=945553 RepID=A0A0D2P4A5_HYPSF|nr:hypothetical protein HYPSUDRAFT_134345 [Hypholoma sublateritium FD-334 SS-4]